MLATLYKSLNLTCLKLALICVLWILDWGCRGSGNCRDQGTWRTGRQTETETVTRPVLFVNQHQALPRPECMFTTEGECKDIAA